MVAHIYIYIYVLICTYTLPPTNMVPDRMSLEEETYLPGTLHKCYVSGYLCVHIYIYIYIYIYIFVHLYIYTYIIYMCVFFSRCQPAPAGLTNGLLRRGASSSPSVRCRSPARPSRLAARGVRPVTEAPVLVGILRVKVP